MKSRKEQIDNLFSKGLSNYQEVPSVSAWHKLERELPKNNRNFYWAAASVSIVLFASSIAWNNILQHVNPQKYAISDYLIKADFPQKEFAPLPIIIHTTTIVYIEKEIQTVVSEHRALSNQSLPIIPAISSTNEISILSKFYNPTSKIASATEPQTIESSNQFPVTIIYKKGNPKYPNLAKTINYIKEVGGGHRQLIDFEKISSNIIARRETNNNSNN